MKQFTDLISRRSPKGVGNNVNKVEIRQKRQMDACQGNNLSVDMSHAVLQRTDNEYVKGAQDYGLVGFGSDPT